MRIGYALDLHASASASDEIVWPRLLEQVQAAEDVGFDLVVLPDHLFYAAGGDGDYARPDEHVGAWESVAVAGALAGATSRIGIGHSVVNAPYRSPALLAQTAATLDALSGGRYDLAIGAGNSFDYDHLGIDADHRVARFAEALEIVRGYLNGDAVHVDGTYWRADGIQRVLRGPRPDGLKLTVAAGGPKTMRLAARFGDAWNGWHSPAGDHSDLDQALRNLDDACADEGRDPATLRRTLDTMADPLDVWGSETPVDAWLDGLEAREIDEARLYLGSDGTHAGRMAAIAAARPLVQRLGV